MCVQYAAIAVAAKGDGRAIPCTVFCESTAPLAVELRPGHSSESAPQLF